MQERLSPYISIMRGSTEIASVLVSQSSVAKRVLMGEHCIRLCFETNVDIEFHIGDFVDDVIFGKYVITENQKPIYNTSTGSFKYELKLDAAYLQLKHYKYGLTSNGNRVTLVWSHTQNLEGQIDEWMKSVHSCGFTEYNYIIHKDDIADCGKVMCMDWNGTDFITALNSICGSDKWNCEWWFEDNTLHIGKCEAGDAMTFVIGQNVESMSAQKNSSDYFNKLYAYGSTNNMPLSYRKNLYVKITDIATVGEETIYHIDRKITPAMVSNFDEYQIKSFDIPNNGYWTVSVQSDCAKISKAGRYNIIVPDTDFGFALLHFNEISTGSIETKITMSLYKNSEKLDEFTAKCEYTASGYERYPSDETHVNGKTIEVVCNANDEIRVFVNVKTISKSNVSPNRRTDYRCSFDAIKIQQSGNSQSDQVNVAINGKSYKVIFNPLSKHQYKTDYATDEDFFAISFVGSAPTGLKAGSEFQITGSYYKIPTAFYSSDLDNPASLARLGGNRLMLPLSTNGYLSNAKSGDSIIEECAVFEDAYPSVKLKVVSISEETKQEYEEYEGESEKQKWQWTAYHMTLKTKDGGTFNFRNDYVDGELKIRFLTPGDVDLEESSQTGFKLAGMTFGCEYDLKTDTFTCVRNTDFGAKLPSEILKPSIGDAVELIGVKINALGQTGVIDEAEQKLKSLAQEYLDAVSDTQFTYTCNMMSSFMFDIVERLAMKDKDGKYLYSSENKQIYVGGRAKLYCRNEVGLVYAIPKLGSKVSIAGQNSRIIGYELKMDKPYDTPQFTVGDTDAYSRLKQIEKKLTKLA